MKILRRTTIYVKTGQSPFVQTMKLIDDLLDSLELSRKGKVALTDGNSSFVCETCGENADEMLVLIDKDNHNFRSRTANICKLCLGEIKFSIQS